MDTLIRDATAADAGRIAALLTQLGYPTTGAEVAIRLGYWSGDPSSRVLVAEDGGRVIGCLSVHAVPYLERTGRFARIESLVVGERARGSGAGRRLVAAAEQTAGAWGCLGVEVTSSRHRDGAHAFYPAARLRRYLRPFRPLTGDDPRPRPEPRTRRPATTMPAGRLKISRRPRWAAPGSRRRRGPVRPAHRVPGSPRRRRRR